jgi:acyl-CoA synthetase (AMP-forming)/AMP-acid ligase II
VPEVNVKLLRPHDGPITLGADGIGGWEVGPGQVGEVAVAGSHVLSGYLNDPDAERLNKIRDGGRVWHRTGDAAFLDGQGRLWLMGRVGEWVRRDGQTWWGGAAEARALDVPGVHHAAYLGIADPELGQRAVLCVETASGTLTPAEQDAIRAALGPMPLDEVRAFHRIPRDPRHASKTDTAALRRLLDGRSG